MIPLYPSYLVIGYSVKAKKNLHFFLGYLVKDVKKGVSIVLFIGGSLSVQVIWLIGYSVKIKREKNSAISLGYLVKQYISIW